MNFINKKNRLNKSGLTLMEILVALLIAGVIFAALIVILMNAHKGMINAYKNNVLKNKVSYAMAHIQSNLDTASRIDFGGVSFNTPCDMESTSDTPITKNYLAGAYNIDKDEGCYPIDINEAPKAFFYCLVDEDMGDEVRNLTLYYYEKELASNDPTKYCPIEDINNGFTLANYPSISNCGDTQMGVTPIKLLDGITNEDTEEGKPFAISRCQYDRVKVKFKVTSQGTEKSKPISYEATSEFKTGMSAQNL